MEEENLRRDTLLLYPLGSLYICTYKTN